MLDQDRDEGFKLLVKFLVRRWKSILNSSLFVDQEEVETEPDREGCRGGGADGH